MAKTRAKEKPEGPTAVDAPEIEAAEPETAEPTGPVPVSEEPREAPERGTKFRTFFQNVEKIDSADWNTRAFITVYRLEPIIDKDRSTEPKWVEKYGEPIDPARLKKDQGSGRYRLYLTFKLPAAKQSREVDVVDVDILDLNYPPNLALGDWVDVPKNRKWAWAKTILEKREAQTRKAEEGPQPAGMNASQVLELVDTIEERVAKRYEQKPAPPPTQNQVTAIDIIETADKIVSRMSQPPAPPTADNEQMRALREDIKYQRERNDALMTQLITAISAKPQGESGLKGLKEIIDTIKTILPDARDLLSPAIDAATGGKSRMTGDQEFWQGIITTVVDKSSPLLNLLGQFMLSRAMQASQRPPAPGAPQPGMTPGLPQPTQQPNQPVSPMPPASPTDVSTPQPEQINQLVMMIGETVATALVEGRAGDAYAESFEGLFGTAAYDQLSALGKERMLQIFQSLPMWEKIGILQSKVPGFIDEFLEYGADEPEVASHKMPPAGKDADE